MGGAARGSDPSGLRLAGLVSSGLPPQRRLTLSRHLASQGAVDAAITRCIVDLIGSHRPQLVADEILKPSNERLERRILAEATQALSPGRFFSLHLSESARRRFERAWPAAFTASASLLGRRESLALSLELDESRLQEEEATVLSRWRSLLGDAKAFDYGCGFGALVSVLGEQFHSSGGDLYESSPDAVLARGLAWLRATRDISREPDFADGRVLRLDARPDEGSPPADGSYAVVTCNGVMEHVIDPLAFEAVLLKLKRLLAPGGVLILNAMPTLLGFDGHHALNPWWGTLLHRVPELQSRAWFRTRWRAGYTHRVSRRRLLAPFATGMTRPIQLWPHEETVRRRLGALTRPVLGLLRGVGRLGLGPIHAVVLSKRLV